jgi:hypothetical protein
MAAPRGARHTPGFGVGRRVGQAACSAGCPLFDGGSIVSLVARLAVRRSLAVGVAAFAGFTAWPGCTTVDPGSNFVIADQVFDANYFYCFVEPQVIFAKQCGSGASTDPPNGCHYNSSAVSGMALTQHPAIDCGGGSAPLDETQVGAGSPAQSNLQAVSLEMSVDYLNAPIILRPTGHDHPRQVFTSSDPVVDIIATWATK